MVGDEVAAASSGDHIYPTTHLPHAQNIIWKEEEQQELESLFYQFLPTFSRTSL